MPYVDIVILVIIAAFAYFGFRSGLIHTLGSLVGTVLGIYLAGRYYAPAAEWVIEFTKWNPNFVRIVVFILLFVISNRLVGILFWFADRTIGLISRFPVLHGLDKLLGAGFGLIEGVIIVGIGLFIITKFPPNEAFMQQVQKSKAAPHVVRFSSFLWPLLPKELTELVGQLSDFKMPSDLKMPSMPTSSSFSLPKLK